MYRKIQRDSIKMKKELKPSVLSKTLGSEASFDFKKVVEDIHALSNALGDIGPAAEDLKLVTKAILQVAKHSAPKPSKPSLNVDDIMDV